NSIAKRMSGDFGATSLDRLRYRRLHRAAPHKVHPPVRIIALGMTDSIMRAARFGPRIAGGRDQETRRQHVLEFPAGDGGLGADLGGVEGLIHHVAAPERDNFARLRQPLLGPLDAYMSPHNAAQRTLHIRVSQLSA